MVPLLLVTACGEHMGGVRTAGLQTHNDQAGAPQPARIAPGGQAGSPERPDASPLVETRSKPKAAAPPALQAAAGGAAHVAATSARTTAGRSRARSEVHVGHDGISTSHRERSQALGGSAIGSPSGISGLRLDPPYMRPDPNGYLGSIDDGRIYVDQDRSGGRSSAFHRVTDTMRLEPSESGLLIGLDMPL